MYYNHRGRVGVANVAAHKAAQNNDVLGDICIASRKLGENATR